MKINFETIPHDEQRYPTVGDWWFDFKNNKLEIRVSDLGNEDFESLVAFHELIEYLLCKHEGIPQELVDDFDKKYEAERKEGNFDEPGDDIKAPYRKQHFFATSLERLMANELGVDWNDYNEAINTL